jgi:hypothetical protein
MSLTELLAQCDRALEQLKPMLGEPWNTAGAIDPYSPDPPFTSTNQEVKQILNGLVDRAADLAPWDQEPPITTTQVRDLQDVTTAITLVKRLKRWTASPLAVNTRFQSIDFPQQSGELLVRKRHHLRHLPVAQFREPVPFESVAQEEDLLVCNARSRA